MTVQACRVIAWAVIRHSPVVIPRCGRLDTIVWLHCLISFSSRCISKVCFESHVMLSLYPEDSLFQVQHELEFGVWLKIFENQNQNVWNPNCILWSPLKSNGPAPDDPKDHGAELGHETENRCILLCSSSSTPAPQRTAPARNLKAVEHDRSWRKDFCLPTIELEATKCWVSLLILVAAR